MAPEQFYGKAVFASDVYSVGVTIYQMLTGSLPYDTPAPADIARLARGDLLTSPRLKNPRIPKAINDIVLRAMAPDLTARYQRASELMNDLLASREPTAATPRRPARAVTADGGDSVADIQSRLKARAVPQASFCWHCRKPLQARTAKCPFCGESQ
jgi:serine/threonine-protein kinase